MPNEAISNAAEDALISSVALADVIPGEAAPMLEGAAASSLKTPAEPPAPELAGPEPAAFGDALEDPGPDWREELAHKMRQYRTRRKPKAPKYPSLQMPLQLQVTDPFRSAPGEASRSSAALEPTLMESEPIVESKLGPELVVEPVAEPLPAPAPSVLESTTPSNLIEFPRSMESTAWDGLAEPFLEQPRILDAPELVPPKPALGGILLEPQQETNALPVSDTPDRPASIARRIFAVILDAAFVGCALALWGWAVSKLIQEVPPRPQLLITALVAAAILWLGYQYLLVTFSGATLGTRACRMELVRFDGMSPERKQLRWRFFASLLSAGAMMLGYAWVLLDEGRLCWHDRITHTYLRVRERQPL